MRRLFLNRKFTLLVVLAVLTAGVALTGYLYRLDLEIQRSEFQDVIARQAASIRASLEQEINTTLNLTQGLVVYVSTNPDLTQDQFAGIASRILQRTPYIRNIGLARDNVITHVYPMEGNEAAIGFRYAESREQWPAVSRAISTGNSVIAGPVNLVQGGRGLISRIPIYTDDAGKNYWGIASLVIDVDAFFDQVGLPDRELQGDLMIALRGKDSSGVAGPVFYGDKELFASGDAETATISLPEGSWALAVYPRGGWQSDSARSQVILSIGLVVSVLVSVLIYALLDALVALSHAKRRAEQANEVKTRFFSHMAHELRTPLTAIQGALGLLTSEAVRQDPEGNVIPPGAFIPAAERYNLMSEIDLWVIRNALAWMGDQQRRNPDAIRLCSLNLSGASVGDDTCMNEIRECFHRYDVDPRSVCFEITETAAISNLRVATRFIKQLKSIGCRFALDDFGSGLSSFGYLKNLPVDYLKIDGTFIKDIDKNEMDAVMVQSINTIGHQMGLKTIAEFVESQEILEVLKGMGIDYVQGYHIDRPRPLEQLEGVIFMPR